MISVLVNAYNYGPFVVDAVQSALEQTLAACEVIVVDDGSTDNTTQLLEERFGSNPLVKIIRQRNGGQLAAFVTGIEHASGDILCFLDADDLYEPNHLEAVAAAFAKDASVDFVFTAHKTFGNEDRVVQQAPEDVVLGFSLIAALKIMLFVGSVTSTLAMRRRLVLAFLPVLRQAAPLWRIRADDCLVYGASFAAAKKLYLAAPTVRYRIHEKNAFAGAADSRNEGFSHNYRRQTLAHLLEDHLGIGDSMYLDLVTEFRSVERPTRLMYGIYCRLNRVINKSLLRRLKARVRLDQHFHAHKATWNETQYSAFLGRRRRALRIRGSTAVHRACDSTKEKAGRSAVRGRL